MFSLGEELMLMMCACMCVTVAVNLDIFLFRAFTERTDIKLLDKDVTFYIPSPLSLFSLLFSPSSSHLSGRGGSGAVPLTCSSCSSLYRHRELL